MERGAIKTKEVETMNIPVLLYHVVKPEPDPANDYQYRLEAFEEQMAYLHENGYETLSMAAFLDVLEGKQPAPDKAVLLTFDDNTADFTEYVMPVLQKYGMKATQFTVTGWIDNPLNMSTEEMKRIDAAGIDVLNHTVSHPALSELGKEEQRAEIADAGQALEQLLGKKQDVFAYPYGYYNGDTMAVLEELGYRAAFIVANEKATPDSPRYELPRYCLLQQHGMADFIDMLS